MLNQASQVSPRIPFQMAVTLDPSNGHAKEMLKKLHFDYRLGWFLCAIAVIGVLVLLVGVVLRRRRIGTI